MNISRLLLCALVPSLLQQPAAGELIGYDSFDYRGTSMAGEDGGAFWDYKNTLATLADPSPAGHTTLASNWDMLFGTAFASSNQLYTVDGGVKREYNGSGESVGAVNEATVHKAVYYRITMTRYADVAWCGLSSFDFGTERLFFGLYPDGTNNFSIYNQTSYSPIAISTVPVNVGQTYTMVARIDFAADVVSLYVNPNLDRVETGSVPVATAAYTGTHWSTALRIASGGSGAVVWDDLTVATSWEGLRSHRVFNANDSGGATLRDAVAAAAVEGGVVSFPGHGSLYAVTDTMRLIRFHRTTPYVLDVDAPITGLLGGDTIAALDFRPGYWALYALGLGPATPAGRTARIYTLNTLTGAASLLSTSPFATLAPGDGYSGFDFDPATDRIRVVSSQGENFRVNPVNGALVAMDSALPAGLSTCAYTPEVLTGAAPTLYAVQGFPASLVRIGGVNGNPPANGGMVTTLRSLGVSFYTGQVGFDIADDGTGFIAAQATTTPVRARLYSVNLATAATTDAGNIGTGTYEIRGLAAAPTAIRLTTGDIRIPFASGGVAIIGPETSSVIISGSGTSRHFSLNGQLEGASLHLKNLTLTRGNGAGLGASFGGSIFSRGPLTLDRCTFVNNASTFAGGAIATDLSRLRARYCTFAGNRSTTGNGGAIATQGDSAVLTHCTFSGNQANGTAALSGGGAIENNGGTDLTLHYCILAGNASASGRGPDVLNQPGSTVVSALYNVIGNATDSTIAHGSGGNIAGTGAAPVSPKLTPLGDFGGPTQTMLLLPGSPAIDLAATSPSTHDQRGLLTNLNPDAGAVEYGGTLDLGKIWLLDWDGDGVPYGMEQATGTDPLTPDAGSLQALRIAASSGAPQLTFAIATAARHHTRWVVKRSSGLTTFSEEIYSFNGRTSTNTVASGIFQGSVGSLVSLRDQLPNPERTFYRLEAQLIP